MQPSTLNLVTPPRSDSVRHLTQTLRCPAGACGALPRPHAPGLLGGRCAENGRHSACEISALPCPQTSGS